MIVSSASDYREAARRKLPRFLFDYIDGGANAEQTMKANIADLNQREPETARAEKRFRPEPRD